MAHQVQFNFTRSEIGGFAKHEEIYVEFFIITYSLCLRQPSQGIFRVDDTLLESNCL